MYIQIADHCNMKCAHCAFSCGPRKKNFMTTEVFIDATLAQIFANFALTSD